MRGYLGLARRSGVLVSGTQKVIAEIESRRAALVLYDEAFSENSRRKILGLCDEKRIPSAQMKKYLLMDACGLNGNLVVSIRKSPLADQMKSIIAEEKSNDMEGGC